jgi:hypothetical protein
MNYDEEITGGVIPVIAAVVLQAVPVAVGAISTLYGKSDEPVKETNVVNVYAEKLSEMSDKPKDEILKDMNENPEVYKEGLQKLVTGLQENKVAVQPEAHGIMTRMGMDWSSAQGYFHKMAEQGAALPVKILAAPFRAVGNMFGWSKSSKQETELADIEHKRRTLAAKGYSEDEINSIIQGRRRKRRGRGEGISKLSIAKLVLLVLIIIMILAHVYTGSYMLLGVVALLSLGLIGVTAYDYLANRS